MELRDFTCNECRIPFKNSKALANHLRHGCNHLLIAGDERKNAYDLDYYERNKARLLLYNV